MADNGTTGEQRARRWRHWLILPIQLLWRLLVYCLWVLTAPIRWLWRFCAKIVKAAIVWLWKGMIWFWNWVRGPSRSGTRHVRRWVRRHRPTLIIGGLIFLFLVVYLSSHIFFEVRSGEAGVLYRLFGGGTVVDYVYGEGIHVKFPWNRTYIYNIRVQEREHTVELLTNEGLKVKFLLSIRYYPEYDLVGYLHKRVGPDYVDTVVVPQVVSVLRVYVGRFSAEEVYTTRRAILERIFAEAIEQVNQRFIKIDQVIIREITLPKLVAEAVEEKLQQKQIAESYEFRLLKEQQEAKRKEIEANGFAAYNETIAKSLSPEILKWKGIEATREMAVSPNSKVIVIGNGDDGLPIILGAGQ